MAYEGGPDLILSSKVKHALHCLLLITLLLTIEIMAGGLCFGSCGTGFIHPFEQYGYIPAICLYLLKFLSFLGLPQCIFNCCGLLFYNAFPDKVQLKGSLVMAPFISIRVVTRGDYPELVKDNVNRNMNTCLDVGLENFLFEVVTDKALNLPKHVRLREVVVPPSYRAKSGALFKARALQYCLEDGINILNDSDWIVHLDEETLLTENSLKGVVNFVLDGKYPFGQGLITYANENVVNWLTTLADSIRVSDDMGKLRFQFRVFHRPFFTWKGSYVVTQAGAERKVSFDHGLDGSISEDTYFSMVAYRDGYAFNFIEGEMWEKSPFTVWDFIQQRKRWFQGLYLVVHSAAIPIRNKFILACVLYSWAATPLTIATVLLLRLYPIPCWQIVNFLCVFPSAMVIYMYIFGVIKSFNLYRLGVLKFTMCVIGALCTIPISIAMENVAVIWGCFGKKNKFYVVNKDARSVITV